MKALSWMILPALLIATDASARERYRYDDYYDRDYGVVVDVRQHRGRVYYERQCQRVRTGHQDAGDALTGAIVGGIIGHQFGGGDGRDAATALGAVIGSQSAGRHHKTVCEDVPVRSTSYIVTYRYHGRLHKFETEDDGFYVGREIEVR